MAELRAHEHELGISWVFDEVMDRAFHALADDDRVWLVDPVDTGTVVDRAQELGTVLGVVQLLDRHARDCEAIALRLGVPHHRLPDTVPGSPFEVVTVLDLPRWREKALWWPGRDALVVAETLGSGRYFAVGSGPLGVHPFLRVRPPGALRRYAPQHVLPGHGAPVHGAPAAVERAYAATRRDLPKFVLKLPTYR